LPLWLDLDLIVGRCGRQPLDALARVGGVLVWVAQQQVFGIDDDLFVARLAREGGKPELRLAGRISRAETAAKRAGVVC